MAATTLLVLAGQQPMATAIVGPVSFVALCWHLLHQSLARRAYRRN